MKVNNRKSIRHTAAVGSVILLSGLSACGTSVATTFPNQLVGADGQEFTVEALESIVNDPDLDDNSKRDAFRELGIEDEKLIEALLGL